MDIFMWLILAAVVGAIAYAVFIGKQRREAAMMEAEKKLKRQQSAAKTAQKRREKATAKAAELIKPADTGAKEQTDPAMYGRKSNGSDKPWAG